MLMVALPRREPAYQTRFAHPDVPHHNEFHLVIESLTLHPSAQIFAIFVIFMTHL